MNRKSDRQAQADVGRGRPASGRYPLLSEYRGVQDLPKYSPAQLTQLAAELRGRIIEVVSKNGGHLASNLGVVELTIALHLVFGAPEDQLVWDVSHQAYAHKLLTGRNDRFDTLRQPGGMSGFTDPAESGRDLFHVGHSSTSISTALGLATAKALRGEAGRVVAVIGDGSFTGGLAYEGLNNAGRSGLPLIVVLNDNEHSISPNVGSFARHLSGIRAHPRYFKLKDDVDRVLAKTPLIGKKLRSALHRSKSLLKYALYHCTIFEDMGFVYLGPVDGHDLDRVCRLLRRARQLDRPVVVHVNTRKGHGYPPAEQTPSLYHAVGPFDPRVGVEPKPADPPAEPADFDDCFAGALLALAEQDPRVCAVTAAMQDGTGLACFAERFPDRFFDVGIAEAHAVSFAAGLARNGCLPVFAVYSTFLQRGYDQLIHDLALNRLHAIVGVDRAGVVGADGETHQGVFDPAFLQNIPGLTVYSPANYAQLRYALSAAVQADGPVVIRYPKGAEPKLADLERLHRPQDYHYCPCHAQRYAPVLLVSYGRLTAALLEAQGLLAMRGVEADCLSLLRIRPVPEQVWQLLERYPRVFCFEEAMQTGGVGEHIAAEAARRFAGVRVTACGVPDRFVPQGTVAGLLYSLGLDAAGMAERVERG